MSEDGQKSKPDTYTPRYLGKAVEGPIDEIERIPWAGGDIEVQLECVEFTAICPITAQPDFARLSIVYVPRDWLIETKSLKLFLQGYREKRAFNEQIVAELADTLFTQLSPVWLRVQGHFNSRGGISLTCSAQRTRES